MFGFLNVNKPSGITSHKVISILRRITGIKQIGHAGTLDPLASGVLPIAIGKATKLIDYLSEDKEYIAGLYLGKISDTFDIEGDVKDTGAKKLELSDIEKVLPTFRGLTHQVPPAFSAVHYNGKRLYELARQGKIPDDIPKREINIYKNEIVDFDYDRQILKLDIACSKGTYIRTIINDIGQALGSGAVMYELLRTKSASMGIENSIILDEDMTKMDIEKSLIMPQDILPIQFIEISEKEIDKVKNGNKIKNMHNAKENVILTSDGAPIALAYSDIEFIQPKKLLI
ncbi:tRNA pseudouridine(55) synthase TruB [bacterium]|nr:tRNA pseudouridine(55) synthase TruB [bacterium]